jgi:hypothetical protein
MDKVESMLSKISSNKQRYNQITSELGLKPKLFYSLSLEELKETK